MSDRKCYFCGSYRNIEKHHVFGGSLRKKSDKYGLVVDLCHWCHNEPPNGVHFNRERSLILKRMAQKKVMQEHGWTKETFIREFDKNYLEED